MKKNFFLMYLSKQKVLCLLLILLVFSQADLFAQVDGVDQALQGLGSKIQGYLRSVVNYLLLPIAALFFVIGIGRAIFKMMNGDSGAITQLLWLIGGAILTGFIGVMVNNLFGISI